MRPIYAVLITALAAIGGCHAPCCTVAQNVHPGHARAYDMPHHRPRALQYDEPQHPVVNVDGSIGLMPHTAFTAWINGHAASSTP